MDKYWKRQCSDDYSKTTSMKTKKAQGQYERAARLLLVHRPPGRTVTRLKAIPVQSTCSPPNRWELPAHNGPLARCKSYLKCSNREKEKERETRSRITLLAREKESLFLSRLCLFSALDLINNVQSSKALRKLSSWERAPCARSWPEKRTLRTGKVHWWGPLCRFTLSGPQDSHSQSKRTIITLFIVVLCRVLATSSCWAYKFVHVWRRWDARHLASYTHLRVILIWTRLYTLTRTACDACNCYPIRNNIEFFYLFSWFALPLHFAIYLNNW